MESQYGERERRGQTIPAQGLVPREQDQIHPTIRELSTESISQAKLTRCIQKEAITDRHPIK